MSHENLQHDRFQRLVDAVSKHHETNGAAERENISHCRLPEVIDSSIPSLAASSRLPAARRQSGQLIDVQPRDI